MSIKHQDDPRPRRKYGPNIKFAINRDGDLFVVECPVCHRQDGLESEDERVKGVFRCRLSTCNTLFDVYPEDGIKAIFDFREGDLEKGSALVWDNGKLCAGINEDAPWWWQRDYIQNKDLQSTGFDAHGHRLYYRVSRVIQ
jgi:hypothetical protein